MSFPQFPDKNRRFNPAAPLRNKRRELFCRLYASDFWGRPEEALKAANYHVQGESAARKTAGMILDSEEVRERIAYLRKIKSENSVADDAWIKESLIKIIEHAKKDSDRIRALSNLKKLLVSTSSSAPGPPEDAAEMKSASPWNRPCSPSLKAGKMEQKTIRILLLKFRLKRLPRRLSRPGPPLLEEN